MPEAGRGEAGPRREADDLDADGSMTVASACEGMRLDQLLAEQAPTRSRTEWQRVITTGAVLVNGAAARAGTRLRAGDQVRVPRAPAVRPTQLEPNPDVPFEVLYADPSMIVVDKPAGVVVHPSPGHETSTLVHGLLARFPDLRGNRTEPVPGESNGDWAGAGTELRPGIVHRLDKDTSGLLVVGRTAAAVTELQRQMQLRQTEKRYDALLVGSVKEDEGFIDVPIGRDPRYRQKMAVRSDGREAQTRFWARQRFRGYMLVEALLITGRTHQLRVHFAYVGHPVAGDLTYGHGSVPRGLPRQFLHARLLRVRSPHDGQERTFETPLPADLQRVLDTLRRS